MERQQNAADARLRVAKLEARMARAGRWAADLKARNAKLAAQLADTQQALSVTLGRLAQDWPHLRDKLMAQSCTAREFAARARQRAARDQQPGWG
jgi:hypothetical protein